MKREYITVEEYLDIHKELVEYLKGIEVRVYLDDEQMSYIRNSFGCARFTYNQCLTYLLKLIKDRKEYVTTAYYNYFCYNEPLPSDMVADKTDEYIDLSFDMLRKHIINLKSKDDYKWLKNVNQKMIGEVIKDFYGAWIGFTKGEKGFPQFKKKSDHEDSCKFNSQAIKGGRSKTGCSCIKSNYMTISDRTFKNIRFSCSNEDMEYLNEYQCCIHNIVFSITKTNKTYAAITITDLDHIPYEPTDVTVGLDMGVKDFCIESNGTKHENKHWHKSIERKLKRLQRKLAKATGVKNREKLRLEIAKLEERVHNQRTNHHHELSAALVKNNQVISVESLKIQNMMKNHHLAKSIQECAWGEFLHMLEYKCKKRGRALVKIDQWFPSSKTCSHCGYKKKDLKLSEREWVCPECGRTLDRDINAAQCINKEGLRIYNSQKDND